MKKVLLSMCMALLLVFSVVPVHALSMPAIAPYQKERVDGLEIDGPDNDVETVEIGGVVEKELNFVPEGQPFDAVALRIKQGHSKQIDSNVWLTYLGPETDKKSKNACERFVLTYTDVYYMVEDAARVEGFAGAPKAARAEAVDAVPALVQTIASTSVASTNEEQAEERQLDAAIQAWTTKKNLEPLLEIVAPGSVEKAIVGTATVENTVVDVDTLEAVVVEDVLPTKQEQAKVDSLFERIATLAREIGREDYILFTTNEDKVGDALEEVLRKKNVRISVKDQYEWQWKPLVQRFIDYNKIDVAAFNKDLRLAQKELVLTQLSTYNALLLLEHKKIDAAADAYEDAMTHYKKFKPAIERLDKEIHRWQPLPSETLAQPILDSSELFITSLTSDKSSVEDGKTVTFKATIRNEGPAVKNVQWIFYNNGYPTGKGSTKKTSGSIASIGENSEATLEFSMPFYYQEDALYNTGSFITVLVVDPDNTIKEVSDENNYRGTTLYVRPQGTATVEPIQVEQPFVDANTRSEVALCVRVGETIPPLTVLDKQDKKQTVTVVYNPLALPQDPPIVIDEDERTYKRKAPEQPTMCVVNGEKVPIGTRLDGQYCDPLTKKMRDQVPNGGAADNNYQCFSNESRGGKCVDSFSLLKRFLKFITSIFG